MSAPLPSDLAALAARRREVRRQLAESIESFELGAVTPDGRLFRGSAWYGPALAGPPGRLHGGLHAYARLFPILEKLKDHDPAATFPCRITLELGKAIPLEEHVSFEGRYRRDADGFVLEVTHAGTDRLRATMRTDRTSVAPLERFRSAHAACRDEPPLGRTDAARTVPSVLHRELLEIEADRRTLREAASLASYVPEDGTIDPAIVCVLLDVAGAFVLGWELDSRCYTVRMDLVLERGHLPGDVDLVALGDRTTRPDASCSARPVEIGGRVVGPTAIDVLVADRDLARAVAYGSVTLVPAKQG